MRNLEVIIVLAVIAIIAAGIYFMWHGVPKRGAAALAAEHEQL